MAAPDDVCEVCTLTRENHGDAHHEFSEDGQLIPKKKPEPPRQSAPKTQEEVAAERQFKAASMATLVEILAEKGILDTPEVIRIFSA